MKKKISQTQLPEGAPVMRIGPSPTGFVHLGNLYNAIIERETRSSKRRHVLLSELRMTDAKREVEGAQLSWLYQLWTFGIHFDEGASVDGDNGAYGPYRQRLRKRSLSMLRQSSWLRRVWRTLRFCSEDDLSKNARATDFGQAQFRRYYGKWAKCRDLL